MTNQCEVCKAEVPLDRYSVVKEGVGLKCDKCKKYYCAKHFKKGETFRPAAGVDTEATWYICPEGHKTMW